MKIIVKLEPYAGDDSALDTDFWREINGEIIHIINDPMWIIVTLDAARRKVVDVDYGYRSYEEARKVIKI